MTVLHAQGFWRRFWLAECEVPAQMMAMRLRMIALYGHARTSAHKSSVFENMSARIMRTEYTLRCIAAMPAILAFLVVLASAPAEARTERDRAQVRAFRAENPCPATGRTRRHSCCWWCP